MFNLKSSFTHEQAKTFIDSIMKSFGQQSNEEHEELIDEEARPFELRHDLTECHYSQFFFIVGHIAIKMLAYTEFLETEVKKILTEGNKTKRKSEIIPEGGEDNKEKEDDDLA